MAALGTDVLAISRGGTHYKTTVADINALNTSVTINDTLTSTSTTEALSANQGKALKDLIDGLGDVTQEATIAARDAAGPFGVGDVVFVDDDGDGKWARYQATAAGATGAAATWVKIADEDALAAGLGATNLGYTASATNGVVTNTSGSDATIPLGTGTNAGLIAPANTTKLGNITISGAVDLDALNTANHAAVDLAGSATTNPLTLAGQTLGFSIDALATAP